MQVRPLAPRDAAAVRAVNCAAFPKPEEADLVEALRGENAVLLELVAEDSSRVLGHILFSRMWVGQTEAVALAPVAVLPAFQKQGIGGALIRTGLLALRERGERIVIVLGWPAYYPRFGFETKNTSGWTHPFPPDHYMALELQPGALDGVTGEVRYARAFGL